MAHPRKVGSAGPPKQPPPVDPGFVPIPGIEADFDEEQIADPMPLAASVRRFDEEHSGSPPPAPRPQPIGAGVLFPNGSSLLNANIHFETDLRLPVAGETVITQIAGPLEVPHAEGDFLLAPGTTIYQKITSAGVARLYENRWIFLVEIGRDLAWVRRSAGPDSKGSYLWEICEDVGSSV